MKYGLIIGKFYPFHIGHKFLMEFAVEFLKFTDVDTLVIMPCWFPGITKQYSINLQRAIQGELDNSQINIVVTQTLPELPEKPEDDIYFWGKWKDAILDKFKNEPIYVFASDTYGLELSKVLNAEFIPCDIDREIVGISGTEIRNELRYYDFSESENLSSFCSWISPCFRKHLKQKICICGPESTGKTTLTQKLKNYFNDYLCIKSSYIPEYGRIYCEGKNISNTNSSEMSISETYSNILKGYRALYNLVSKDLSDYLFIDTNEITTLIYTEQFLKESWSIIVRPIDLYIVLEPTETYFQDPCKYDNYEKRLQHFKRTLDFLKNKNYIVLEDYLNTEINKTSSSYNYSEHNKYFEEAVNAIRKLPKKEIL